MGFISSLGLLLGEAGGLPPRHGVAGVAAERTARLVRQHAARLLSDRDVLRTGLQLHLQHRRDDDMRTMAGAARSGGAVAAPVLAVAYERAHAGSVRSREMKASTATAFRQSVLPSRA